MTRRDIEDQIERLLSILDAMDGDADLEADADFEPSSDWEDDPSRLDAPGFIWGGGEGGGPAHSGR